MRFFELGVSVRGRDVIFYLTRTSIHLIYKARCDLSGSQILDVREKESMKNAAKKAAKKGAKKATKKAAKKKKK
jgi:predicted restriction endonuclease